MFKTLLNNSNLLNGNHLESKVIHCGVPKNQFVRKNYLNLKIGENNEFIFKIGMVSRLDPDKGHEDLVIAFSELPFEYKKKMTLIIVGENVRGQKMKLKNLVSNLERLYGKVRTVRLS